MAGSRERASKAEIAGVVADINNWYRTQISSGAGPRSARIEEINVGEVWMEFDLADTKLEGYLLDPFVHDLGRGQWIQGWSDGWTLSVAVPCASAPFALGFVRALA
ncbi:MAG: hypothetical protein RIB98_03250 [Acidimicrobiales bacterium]